MKSRGPLNLSDPTLNLVQPEEGPIRRLENVPTVETFRFGPLRLLRKPEASSENWEIADCELCIWESPRAQSISRTDVFLGKSLGYRDLYRRARDPPSRNGRYQSGAWRRYMGAIPVIGGKVCEYFSLGPKRKSHMDKRSKVHPSYN